jgi:hypothetical protein
VIPASADLRPITSHPRRAIGIYHGPSRRQRGRSTAYRQRALPGCPKAATRSARAAFRSLLLGWFNAAVVDAVVRVEVTQGERFAHMIETLFGLARDGYVNAQWMPNLLQLALTAQNFPDVIVFRKPPSTVQRAVRTSSD